MILLEILGFACLAHLAADLATYIDLPHKPFQCSLCMGFWLSVVPFIYMYESHGVLLASITGVVSELIYRLINRL